MQAIECPLCKSQRTWRDGIRQTSHGDVQRWLCRECGYRFSETSQNNCSNGSKHSEYNQKVHRLILKTPEAYLHSCQVGDRRQGGAKNLVEVVSRTEKQAAGATEKADIKGKIVEFAWQLKKDGLAETTIESYVKQLRILQKKGANLADPEAVKGTIALQDHWSKGTKHQAVQAYNKFAKLNGIKWTAPKYKRARKKPFIPLEKELDALIASCGKRTATRLQLLKETGMRIGEALRLEWTDVDFERNAITVNDPEKNGESRQIQVSNKLMAMINRLPKKNNKVLGGVTYDGASSNLNLQRKKAAVKLQNPRLTRITFHTLRHWKATMEYHKTRDILHVKQLLGHRDINTTLIYTHLVSFRSNDYHVAIAKKKEKKVQLLSEGWEFICQDSTDGLMYFRKRK